MAICLAGTISSVAISPAVAQVDGAGAPRTVDDQDLATILRKLPPSDRVATLSTMMRTVGRANPDKIGALFLKTPDALPGPLSFQGGPEIDRLVWARFFTGAIIDVGNAASPRPIVGYYNPVLETWLITQWDATLPLPKVERSYLTQTGALKDPDAGLSATQPVPGWVTAWRSAGLVPAIQRETQRSVAAFENRYQPKGTDAITMPIPSLVAKVSARNLHTRAGIMAESLEKAIGTPKRQVLVDQVLEALRDSDKARLQAIPGSNGQDVLIDDVLALPQATRAVLLPSAAMSAPDGFAVLAVSAATPRIIVVIEIKGLAGSPRLARLATFDSIGGR